MREIHTPPLTNDSPYQAAERWCSRHEALLSAIGEIPAPGQCGGQRARAWPVLFRKQHSHPTPRHRRDLPFARESGSLRLSRAVPFPAISGPSRASNRTPPLGRRRSRGPAGPYDPDRGKAQAGAGAVGVLDRRQRSGATRANQRAKGVVRHWRSGRTHADDCGSAAGRGGARTIGIMQAMVSCRDRSTAGARLPRQVHVDRHERWTYRQSTLWGGCPRERARRASSARGASSG